MEWVKQTGDICMLSLKRFKYIYAWLLNDLIYTSFFFTELWNIHVISYVIYYLEVYPSIEFMIN